MDLLPPLVSQRGVQSQILSILQIRFYHTVSVNGTN